MTRSGGSPKRLSAAEYKKRRSEKISVYGVPPEMRDFLKAEAARNGRPLYAEILARLELVADVIEWCEAWNQWHQDLVTPLKGHAPVGFPRTVTRNRLYHAGRKLFEAGGVDPHEHGVYFLNEETERAEKRKTA